MMKTTVKIKQIVTATGFAVAVMFGAPVATHYINVSSLDMVSQAYAADDGDGGSGKKQSGKMQKGSTGGKGSMGSGGKGNKDIMMKGQGGPGEDSDRPAWAGVKGGKAGAGGRPEGAGSKKGDLYGDLYVLIRDPVTGVAMTETIVIEGVPTVFPLVQAYLVNADGTTTLLPGVSIPRDPATGDLLTNLADGRVVTSAAVEFSRLSVSRAPSKVSSKSLTEVTSKLATATSVTFDVAGRLVINGATVDSPLENLALYQAILKAGGTLTLPTATGSVTLTLANAAVFLGAAADKAGKVTLDTVMYLDPILGVPGAFPSTTFSFDPAIYNTTVWVGTVSGSTVTWTQTTLAAAAGLPAQTPVTGAIDFAAAADAARAVIQFVHDAPLISYTDPMAP